MADKKVMGIMEMAVSASNQNMLIKATESSTNMLMAGQINVMAAGIKNELLYKPNDVIENLYNNRETILNNPATNITPPQFGILGHLDPSRIFLQDAIKAITDLREQLVGNDRIANKVHKLFSEIKAINKSEDLGIPDDQLDVDFWGNYNKTKDAIFSIEYDVSEKFDSTIYFDSEKFLDKNRETLTGHVEFLKTNSHTVTLEAYAYGSTSAVNLAKSDQQANAISQYLVSQGIAASRIIKRAMGDPDDGDKNRVILLFAAGVENNLRRNIKRSGITTMNRLDMDIGKVSSVYSTALFATANNYKKEIREIDQLQNQLMTLQNQLSHALVRKRNLLVKLDAEIPVLQRSLANLNQERIKALAEYQMVLSLVAEDWQKVAQEYARREKILTNHNGLYFVRAQETPFNRTSLVDRQLRYGRIEDLVPATAIHQDELPEDIEDYIEAIVDIPIANWRVFNDSWSSLPSRNTIIKLMEQRKLRLTYLSQKKRKASSSKFVSTLKSHQSILQDYARFEFVQEASLQAFYRRAVSVISLEDLLTGSPHQLRSQAQAFRNQLDQATHALLAKLQNIKPATRMAWATAAELDQLNLRNPNTWPGLKEEQEDDINNLRSLIELVNWWWRQLNDNASSASVTAISNLLRAVMMVSVGDDPKEMIHGYLQVIPGKFKAGDLLRATLNRHVPLGTFLQLVNERNELIGKLRVEDADENGSVVSIAQVLREETITTASQFSVVGIKTSGRSFV